MSTRGGWKRYRTMGVQSTFWEGCHSWGFPPPSFFPTPHGVLWQGLLTSLASPLSGPKTRAIAEKKAASSDRKEQNRRFYSRKSRKKSPEQKSRKNRWKSQWFFGAQKINRSVSSFSKSQRFRDATPWSSFPCLFGRKEGKSPKKTRIFYSCRSPQSLEKEKKNAQKNKYFWAFFKGIWASSGSFEHSSRNFEFWGLLFFFSLPLSLSPEAWLPILNLESVPSPWISWALSVSTLWVSSLFWITTFISCYRTPGPQRGLRRGLWGGLWGGLWRVFQGF